MQLIKLVSMKFLYYILQHDRFNYNNCIRVERFEFYIQDVIKRNVICKLFSLKLHILTDSIPYQPDTGVRVYGGTSSRIL